MGENNLSAIGQGIQPGQQDFPTVPSAIANPIGVQKFIFAI